MISEETENEVIKVKYLVAKWENVIKKQDPNYDFICSVRQVLDLSRESRKKFENHPLENVDFETALSLPTNFSRKQDTLSLPTNLLNDGQKPRNKLSQFKDKCSEIITKNVRKSKQPPPLYPRPQSFSSHSTKTCQHRGLTRTYTVPSKSYRAKNKNIELKNVEDEEFEIIDAEDCLLDGAEEVIDTSQLHVQPLDLRSKRANHTSIESLDSGYDTNTPRNSETRFLVSTPECNTEKNFDELREAFDKEFNKLNITDSSREPESDASSGTDDLKTNEEKRSGEEEQFNLFVPRTSETAENVQYLESLRCKLRTHVTSKRHSVSHSVIPISEQPLSEEDETFLEEEEEIYQDPDLDEFLLRCFKIINPINSKLRLAPDDLLINCFAPKEIVSHDFCFDLVELDAISSSVDPSEADVFSDGEFSLEDNLPESR